MKTLLFAFTALFTLILNTSCQKKPNASFTSSKEEYNLNESVDLSNSSSDASAYTWIVTNPKGIEKRSTAVNFSFQADITGSYDIRLAAYSRNGKYTSKSSKTITVKDTKGSIIFYTTRSGISYDINRNGAYLGTCYTQPAGIVPECGSSGCCTYTAAGGQYVFNVANYFTSTYKTYTLTIVPGSCQPQLVNF